MKRPFVINISGLMRTSGARRDISHQGHLDELAVSGSQVPHNVDVLFTGSLQAVEGSGIVVDGRLQTQWVGECRRCLGVATGAVDLAVNELFTKDAVEGETYPIENDLVDLEALIREAVMLELPLVPVCRDDCAGLCPVCGVNRNEVPCNCVQDAGDPRWATLDVLKLNVLKQGEL